MAHSVDKTKLPVLVGGSLRGNRGPQAVCYMLHSKVPNSGPTGINLGEHLSLKEPRDEPLDTHLSTKP